MMLFKLIDSIQFCDIQYHTVNIRFDMYIFFLQLQEYRSNSEMLKFFNCDQGRKTAKDCKESIYK